MYQARIALACEQPDIRSYLIELLERNGCKVEMISNEEALAQCLGLTPPDLVLLDTLFAARNSLPLLELCGRICPQQKVVMVSSTGDSGEITLAVRLGAEDFITSPIRPERLQALLGRVLGRTFQVSIESKSAPAENDSIDELGDELFFFAAGPVMKQLRTQAALLASVDMPVFLIGEVGSGKEVVARLIHKLSPRAHGTFLKVNCATLPADLLESEIFGYEAGAFIDGHKSKPGRFELAHKCTLLLDEVGEMSPCLQAKLLHVLQDGYYSRLGGRTDLAANARILAATNVDVEMAIAEGKFHQDLYYRLNALTVSVPPLRERPEEIPLLLHHFMIRQAAKLGKPALPLSARFVKACVQYPWPGNLRELSNIVRRYLVLEDDTLILDDLRFGAAQPSLHRPQPVTALSDNLKDEFKEIKRALETSRWNSRLAALRLHMSHKMLLSRMKVYRLYPPSERGNRQLSSE